MTEWLELIDGWPLEHCAGCADLQAAHGLTDGECVWMFHMFPRPLQENGVYS